jgi:hypothetical protein
LRLWDPLRIFPLSPSPAETVEMFPAPFIAPPLTEEPMVCVHGMASVSSLWLPDEAKIETEQEEDEMDDGAAPADLRRFDKTCPQQRHRNIGEIEIE